MRMPGLTVHDRQASEHTYVMDGNWLLTLDHTKYFCTTDDDMSVALVDESGQ